MTIIHHHRPEVVFSRRNSNRHRIERVPIGRYGHHITMTIAAAAAAAVPLAIVAIVMMLMTMIKATNTIIIIIMAVAVTVAVADTDIGQANINIGTMITIKDNFMVAIVINLDDIVVMHPFTTKMHQRQM